MTRYVCSGDKLTAIGDAIRAKTKTTDTMTLDEMATAVSNISTGVDLPDGEGLYYTGTNLIDTNSSTSKNLYVIFGDTLEYIVLPNVVNMPGYICYRLTKLSKVDLPVCTSIDGYAFQKCSNLATVDLPVCTSIGNYAFQGCSSLAEVNLPVCTSIRSYAFSGCTSLATELNLPDCTVSYYSFQNCPLRYIDVKSASYSSFYGLLDTTSVEDLYITLRMTSITIPGFFAIGNGDMYTYSGTTYGYSDRSIFGDTNSSPTTKLHISLPNCTKFEGAVVASFLPSSGVGTFSECTSLVEVNLPVCTSIGSYAFKNCSNLTTIDLPVCTSIGNYAFYYCSNLTTIDLPVCTSIGNYAFYGCLTNNRTNDLHMILGLESVTTSYRFYIGTNSSYYSSSIFYNSNVSTADFSLHIDLPVCTSIGSSVFYYCTKLTTVDLPVCTSIGNYAFQGCSSLATIILRSDTICTLDATNAFYKCTALTSIFVPDTLVDSYKAATNWSSYANYIKPLSDINSPF